MPSISFFYIDLEYEIKLSEWVTVNDVTEDKWYVRHLHVVYDVITQLV